MLARRKVLAMGMAVPFLGLAGEQTEAAAKPASTKQILLIGIDPKLVDYSKLPDLDAQKLSAILDDQKAKLVELGFSARWCFIDAGPTAQRKVVDTLLAFDVDVVSIGAGIRLPPENLLLFERVLNAVHHHAPRARICFSKTANDTVEAVQRWVGDPAKG